MTKTNCLKNVMTLIRAKTQKYSLC